MFTLTFLLGFYPLLLFFLGILGLFYPSVIRISFLVFLLCCLIVGVTICQNQKFSYSFWKSKKTVFLTSLLMLQIFVNLTGALGPELSFDALWYHLTLPKLFLLKHTIYHIPGGVFYYSDMPKLMEMYYAVAISFQSEIIAKVLHFFFGILCLFALYQVSRKFLTPIYSLLCISIFYASLVVGWESTTAYVDLTRTFFEIMSFTAFINWYTNRSLNWLITLGFCCGFVITDKLLGLGTLVLFCLLITSILLYEKKLLIIILKDLGVLLLCAVSVPLPWLLFAYHNTGNPLYPFFTATYPVVSPIVRLNPFLFIHDIVTVFIHADDPVSPVFIAVLPIVLWEWRTMKPVIKVIVMYAGLAICLWYVTPHTGGGRFLLPYTPVFSFLCTYTIALCFNQHMKKIVFGFIIIVSLISILYRGIANGKYIPVLTGQESKKQFLTDHLNFSFGDFYDTDGYFARHIKQTDRVLLIGFHNYYYISFPFADASTGSVTSSYTYIATQHTPLPLSVKNWHLVHQNEKTGVNIYTK